MELCESEKNADDVGRIEEWSKKQDEIKEQIIVTDTEPWQIHRMVFSGLTCAPRNFDNELHLVAGFDLSFLKSDPDVACVSAVVCRVVDLEIVYKDCYMVSLNCPYVPGFLAFREADFVIEAFRKLECHLPKLIPQVILIDGNGVLHKKGCGLACHVGVSLDMPTVGVAKNLYHVDGIQKDDEYKEKVRMLTNKGDSFPLIHENGQQLGLALKTCAAATKPVYISIGHKISLKTSSWVVNLCSKYRVPEPIRQADIISREFMRKAFPHESPSK